MEKLKGWINSFSLKMVLVATLAIILLIPTAWIQKIITERKRSSEKVVNDISNQWAMSQIVSGPILNIPYSFTEINETKDGVIKRKGIAHFLPNLLDIEAIVDPEIRYRSIYKMAVYKSNLLLKGNFEEISFAEFDLPNIEIKWQQAFLSFGISDLRGIEDQVDFTINNRKLNYEPGMKNTDIHSKGFTINMDSLNFHSGFEFKMKLNLNGSSNLSFEPIGKITKVKMNANWSDPSFTGSFLPKERKIEDDKFSSNWIVTHLNRNFPQKWLNKKYSTSNSQFGVNLFLPVDHYQKSTRAVKYAILFILLNFIVLLFIEIRIKKRIHPFQYALVAFALLLFYTLLISISEQLGFNFAYLISSISITTLISWYSKTIVEELKPVIWIAFLQILLYIFLFTILQLQDYALLMGSIGLFIILGVIMKVSKNINWYNTSNKRLVE